MKYFLKHITELTWIAGLLLSVLALCMFVPDFLTSEPLVWQTVVTMILTVGNAVLLMYLVYQVGITRTRSSLPVFCYLLLVGVMSQLHSQWEGQMAVLGLQSVVLLLMRAYRSDNAVHESFLSTLIISITALFLPDMLFLLPVLWIGLSVQRAMNLRVVLASLIAAGLFVLYVWISSTLFPSAFSILSIGDTYLHTLPSAEALLPLLFLAVAAVVFAVTSLLGFARENSRAQSLVLILLMLLLVSVVMMFFPPKYFSSLLAVAVYSVAALSAYCFCTRQSVAMGVIFIVYILLSLALFTLTLLNLPTY